MGLCLYMSTFILHTNSLTNSFILEDANSWILIKSKLLQFFEWKEQSLLKYDFRFFQKKDHKKPFFSHVK